MTTMDSTRTGGEHVGTVVIGAGQAGLSVGYHLARRGLPFVILDAGERIGDPWRARWDSLRLFTLARLCGLDGMPFPAPPRSFPTKDEMADYLQAYAERFELPVRTRTRVDHLTRDGGRFVLAAGDRRLEADNVVVAMANYQRPRVPAFAADLDPGIVQLHSIDYRRPDQLRDGGVLLVGAGNSGAEIAAELAPTHDTWLAGRDVGHVPVRTDRPRPGSLMTRFVLRFVFHRVLSVRTPIGRRVRPTVLAHGGPLIRVTPAALDRLGVHRVERVVGARDGRPMLGDGTVLDVANVVWCTGFEPGFAWIDLPIHGELEPLHERGVVPTVPGLYFVGLEFLSALSSSMIHGVGRDADRIAGHIAAAATRPRRPAVAA